MAPNASVKGFQTDKGDELPNNPLAVGAGRKKFLDCTLMMAQTRNFAPREGRNGGKRGASFIEG